MQRVNSRIFRKRACGELTIWFAFLLAAGCSSSSAGPDTAAPPKPLAGTTLVVSCPDESLRKMFEPWVRVWAHESGARVTVSEAAMKPGDAVDVAILPAAELGAWAERGELAVLSNSLREAGNPYQFSSVLPPFRGEAFIGWGNQLFAAPVASHAPIVVYRADRFADPETRVEYRKRFGRDLAAPATWEEFADIATFFAERDKRPSLPPLNASGLEDLFLRVAACHDRPALAGDGSDTAGLAFAFDLDTGKARLESLGFVQAALDRQPEVPRLLARAGRSEHGYGTDERPRHTGDRHPRGSHATDSRAQAHRAIRLGRAARRRFGREPDHGQTRERARQPHPVSRRRHGRRRPDELQEP